MKSKFRILHLEDSEADCELVHQLLVHDGIDCDIVRCDNRDKFILDLQSQAFDLIFADCTLPQFNGIHALELACQIAPGIPFIFVSGTIEEDSAIESLRSGATDYVLKNRLSRLLPAVRRAIAETDERAKSQDMEQRLRQAQRLEAVGTLAGGIAHDFNNILTIIKGYTSLLPTEAGRPERVREIAGTIDRASQRGSELVGQLLAFARKSDGSFASTDLNQRIREVASMLRPALPSNIVFELQLEDGLPEIHADAGQVERVIINLATNARDAMPDGGKIIFATGKIRRDETPPHSAPEADSYLRLRVIDTGFGMDEATRQRIFEPFFTTKPRGKGTGLGMPVVYGLMQSHHGLIDVQSAPGQGTAISLFFPISEETPLPRIAPLPNLPRAVDGTETVLIVDDESDLRNLVEMILSVHGYHVFPAKNAEEALAMLSAHPGEVHLLFSDVGLPTIDGFELSQRVKALHPRLKTVLCSGDADGDLKARLVGQGIDGFIAKPFGADGLLQVVRAVLDKEEWTI
jgi:two-component system cell cycle sensor histidine kinase/response regulator CckA